MSTPIIRRAVTKIHRSRARRLGHRKALTPGRSPNRARANVRMMDGLQRVRGDHQVMRRAACPRGGRARSGAHGRRRSPVEHIDRRGDTTSARARSAAHGLPQLDADPVLGDGHGPDGELILIQGGPGQSCRARRQSGRWCPGSSACPRIVPPAEISASAAAMSSANRSSGGGRPERKAGQPRRAGQALFPRPHGSPRVIVTVSPRSIHQEVREIAGRHRGHRPHTSMVSDNQIGDT